jgi:hypothetical protein
VSSTFTGATRAYHRNTWEGRTSTPAADGSLWIGIAVPAQGGGFQRLTNGILKLFLAPNKMNGETLTEQDSREER